jgi:hypothetical protein
MDPQKAANYNNSNTNKRGIYRTFVTNNYPPDSSSASFNQLIHSGIVHPTGVLIVPFLAPVRGTTTTINIIREGRRPLRAHRDRDGARGPGGSPVEF